MAESKERLNKSTKHYNRIAELIAHKQEKEVIYKKERQAILKREIQKTQYRYFMIQSFHRNPLKCKCGGFMIHAETHNLFEEGIKNDIIYK